jgi:uncharacterized repeat protein (TIGR02543 family)
MDHRNGYRWEIYSYNYNTGQESLVGTAGSMKGAPALDGNFVVWSDDRNGNWDVYGYNLATHTEFPICVDPGNQGSYDISGNIVIYSESSGNNVSIYGYDLNTSQKFPISTQTGIKRNARISGNFVVWEDSRNDPTDVYNIDIYGYDLNTSQEFPICTIGASQTHPAISGNIVVWQDARNCPDGWSEGNIYGYNLATHTEFQISATHSGNPDISGTVVVWQDWRDLNHKVDIYGIDLAVGEEFPVATSSENQLTPRIHNNRVVWCEEYRNDYNGGSAIYGYTLDQPDSADFAISTLGTSISRSAISGSIAVWAKTDCNYVATSRDIYGYDFVRNTSFPICAAPGEQTNPAVSGAIVVWDDNREGRWDIYGFDITTGLEFPICVDPNYQGGMRYPAIDGGIVVWRTQGSGSPGGDGIYGYDLATRQNLTICTGTGTRGGPVISGNTVVWWDNRNIATGTDIYGYDLVSHTEFPVCTAPGIQDRVKIFGNTVVWVDQRHNLSGDNSFKEIYGYNLTTHQEYCISNSGLADNCTVSGNLVIWQEPIEPSPRLVDTLGYDIDNQQTFAIRRRSTYRPAFWGKNLIWEEFSCRLQGLWGSRMEVDSGQQAADIVSTLPLPGETETYRQRVAVIFGGAMNHASAEAAFSIDPPVSGSFSWQGPIMFFTPAQSLAPNTIYTCTMAAGAAALDGSTLAAPYVWHYATTTIIETVTVTAAAEPAEVRSLGQVTLEASATDNLGHDIGAWSWSDNGAGGMFSDPNAQNPTWTAPVNVSGAPITYHLTVIARCALHYDAAGTDTDEIIVDPDQLPVTPVNWALPNGTTGVCVTPTLVASGFADADADDVLEASEWQISTNAGFTEENIIWDILQIARYNSQGECAFVPEGILAYNTQYWWRVRFQDSSGGWSNWSQPTSFTTTGSAITAPDLAVSNHTINLGTISGPADCLPVLIYNIGANAWPTGIDWKIDYADAPGWLLLTPTYGLILANSGVINNSDWLQIGVDPTTLAAGDYTYTFSVYDENNPADHEDITLSFTYQPSGAPAPGRTERVVFPAPVFIDEYVLWKGASTDRHYLLFNSENGSLVAGDTNGVQDAFVYDTVSRTTERVSVINSNTQLTSGGFAMQMSRNGRFVLFWADGNVSRPTQLYIRDRQAGTTTLVSINNVGAASNERICCGVMSEDGQYIAFRTNATNLVAGATSSEYRTYLRNRNNNTTTVIIGPAAEAGPMALVMSTDGNIIAAGPAQCCGRGFGDAITIYNRGTGVTTPLPAAYAGHALSDNGRYLAYSAYADGVARVYDRQTSQTEIVSVDPNGNPCQGYPFYQSLSTDGRYVSFESNDAALVPGDVNHATDVFLRDRQTQQTERLSLNTAGIQGNADSALPSVSPDASYVFFWSEASNLVPADPNNINNLYVRIRHDTEHLFSVQASADPNSIASGGTTQLSASYTDSKGHAISYWTWSDNGAGGTFIPSAHSQNSAWVAPGNTGPAAVTRHLTVTATCTNGMSENKDVIVTEKTLYYLAVTASPSSGGTVTGTGRHDQDTLVTITATTNPGWRFAGWTGAVTDPNAGTTTVLMDADKNVIAHFIRIYTISASVSPVNSGTVQGAGTYDTGTTATLRAIPATGYWFAGWSGDLTGLTNPADITMDADKSVTATFTRYPTAPTGVTATALSSTQIRLDWNFTGTVTGFKIYRKVGAGVWSTTPIATVGNTVRSYTNSALLASTLYTYRICAYNSYGNSPYSSEAAATTFIYIAAPTTLAAKAASSSQVNLTWLDKSTNETGFCIERRLGTAGSWEELITTAAGATSYADTSCTPSTLYNYRVCAKVDEASSGYSNTASVTTPFFVAAPTELTATALAYNQIGLTWSFAGTTAGFKIYRCTGTGAWGTTPVATVGATVRSYTNSSLTASTSYTYRVCAYSGTASSAPSNEASATTMIFVATPTTLVAKAASATQVNLTWVDKSTNETGFSIERRLGTTGAWAEVGTVGAGIKAYSDTTTDPNTSYGYRVRAIADGAVSAYSNIASVKTPIYVATPTDLVAASASATSIALTWTDNADNESGYKIERRKSTVTTWTVVATTLANVTSFTNTGLTTGTTYIYRVRAYKSTTYSSYSNEATATAGTP